MLYFAFYFFHSTNRMLAITIYYLYYRDNTSNIELFVGENAKEESKKWLINEIYKKLYNWFQYSTDENTGEDIEYSYNNEEDVKNALKKETLENIIRGIELQGGFEIICKIKM